MAGFRIYVTGEWSIHNFYSHPTPSQGLNEVTVRFPPICRVDTVPEFHYPASKFNKHTKFKGHNSASSTDAHNTSRQKPEIFSLNFPSQTFQKTDLKALRFTMRYGSQLRCKGAETVIPRPWFFPTREANEKWKSRARKQNRRDEK